MAELDDLYSALKKADAAGDSDGARKLAAYIQTRSSTPAPTPAAPPKAAGDLLDTSIPFAGNLSPRQIGQGLVGVVRGGKDVIDTGASLLAHGVDTLTGGAEGERVDSLNKAGKEDFNTGYGSSTPASVGRTIGQVAATAPIGGLAALPFKAAARFAPALSPLAEAVASSGLTTGSAPAAGFAGQAGNVLTRGLGGAVTGGLSAGAVDPQDATAGAAIGAALPGVLKVAGTAGNRLGSLVRGPDQSADLAAAVQAARNSGYVIPPSQANPTLMNRALEGFAGKLTTAQNASVADQAITNSKAAKALGLPGDTKLTPDVLNNVRQTAGQAYQAVASTGVITPTPAYEQALDVITANARKAAQGFPGSKPNPLIAEIDSLKSPRFDASSAVAKISSLRADADAAYASGNKELGKALKSGAGALEDAIEVHLKQIGATPDLLNGFRDARQTIAKTYSVQKALNSETGTVDAQKLAGQLARGKPLSGDLQDIASFAARFPKAAQTPERMGSLPGVSPLDFAASGGISAATGNPLMMAGVLARPVARAAVLSPIVQNRLIQGARSGPLNISPNLLLPAYRSAPLVGLDP